MYVNINGQELRIWVRHESVLLHRRDKRPHRISRCLIQETATNTIVAEHRAICHENDQFVRRIGSIKAVAGALNKMLGRGRKDIIRDVMRDWKTQGRKRTKATEVTA